MNKIIKSHRGIYYVENNNEIVLSKARGVFRNQNIKPVVGDNVKLSINNDGTGYIDEVFERKNQLLRPPIANVDQVIVVMSILSPDINLNLLDRYLLMLEKSKVDIKIIFNKIDLLKNDDLNYIFDIYRNIGYEIFLNSNNETKNKETLKKIFNSKITAVAGPSGVGKSTTLNNVFEDLDLDTGLVSKKTQRGKHTTRTVKMLKINENTYIIDTPGFSSLDLSFIEDRAEIRDNFIEFKKFSANCKFHNCFHINEPSCAVKEAVKVGDISEYRYNNYKLILEEYDNIRRY